MWIIKYGPAFLSERLFISRTLKSVGLWLSFWCLSHLDLQWAPLSALTENRCSGPSESFLLSTFQVLWALQFITCQLSTSCFKRIFWEWEELYRRIGFIKDQCFGAMKMRNEGSQDTAPLNPILVFAAGCLVSSACFYSDKYSKSLTWCQYHLNSLQIFLVENLYWFWFLYFCFKFKISKNN